jgi:Flp pilus assembly protein CpaB
MIAAGVIAAAANYALLTADDPSTEVVVLASAAPPGTPVAELDLQVTSLAIDDPQQHGLVDRATLDQLLGTTTTGRLAQGALLRVDDLRSPQADDARAMSLPIGTARAVGGLLQPGDRVDVIAGGADGADYVARDLAVLDVGEGGGGLAGAAGYAVTVSVDADEALRLARALRTGDLDLVRTEAG